MGHRDAFRLTVSRDTRHGDMAPMGEARGSSASPAPSVCLSCAFEGKALVSAQFWTSMAPPCLALRNRDGGSFRDQHLSGMTYRFSMPYPTGGH